jgi:aromatic ring-opening dioxygenase LigB subunit
LTSLKGSTGAGKVLISPEDITLPHLLHSTIKQHIDKYRKRMHPVSISMQNQLASKLIERRQNKEEINSISSSITGDTAE